MYTKANIITKANLRLAFDRLITNPESTYKSFFRDTYSTYMLAAKKNLAILRKELNAGYIPEKTIRVFMPKANGLSRMYTLMSIKDQIVYQAFANVLGEAIKARSETRKRYKKTVFGNLCSLDSKSQYFYQNWQSSYKAYTYAITRAYNEGNQYIASFDLTACYDSINHNLLQTILKEKFRFSDNCAGSFTQFLAKWQQLETGIPQGPQASGIVAEAVLQEFDSYVEQFKPQIPFRYFRYVDDIRILAENEETVRWVLFLLDKKSKELGLFPQSSKISVHKITNIEDEIKRISKPLFEDDVDEDEKGEIAVTTIRTLIRKNSKDLTTIRRYFQCVRPNSRSNRLAIAAVKKYPNLIHSFAYYVKKYPRKIPPSISNFAFACCNDKTQQFASGLLLDAIIDNLNEKDRSRFAKLAKSLLETDKKQPFIFDSRFRLQLISLTLLDGKLRAINKRYIADSDWWVKSNLIYQARKKGYTSNLGSFPAEFVQSVDECELAIAGSSYYIPYLDAQEELPSPPQANSLTELAHNILYEARVIAGRSRNSSTQISRYLKELTGVQYKFQWKSRLGKDHNHVEGTLYRAINYWNSDLTAFVNIWDTIDDRICSLLVPCHPELCKSYQLGKIGGIKQSTGFINNVPKFHEMCQKLHELRLQSDLSHAEIKGKNQYTGPIQQKEKKRILKLITEGIKDLIRYW